GGGGGRGRASRAVEHRRLTGRRPRALWRRGARAGVPAPSRGDRARGRARARRGGRPARGPRRNRGRAGPGPRGAAARRHVAGEAFDKVAKLLGLGFPGGPIVQRTAESGDPAAIAFPAARMSDGARDFSFSGIKTSVSLYVKRHGPLSEGQIADVAASFQAAVVRMLVRRTLRACVQTGVKRVVLTGSVAANTPLRETLAAAAAG